MKIEDYTREEKQQALDEAWELMNPKVETNEERLQNMSPLGVDGDGNLLVKHEDWFWLSERALESEDAMYGLSETLRQEQGYNERILVENERLREALKDIRERVVKFLPHTDISFEIYARCNTALEVSK